MNATDFLTRNTHKELAAKAARGEAFNYEREFNIDGNKYTVKLHTARDIANGEFRVCFNYFFNLKRADNAGRNHHGGASWFDDFGNYEAVKEQINSLLCRCPDFDDLEQLNFF